MNRKVLSIAIIAVLAIASVGVLAVNRGDSEQGEVKGETVQVEQESEQKTDQDSQPNSELKFSDILADIESGAKFYDVREPAEFAAGHFEKAENYSVQLLLAGEFPEIPKDTKIYVHCRSGVRSTNAEKALKEAGFTDVINLLGLVDIEKIGGELISEED